MDEKLHNLDSNILPPINSNSLKDAREVFEELEEILEYENRGNDETPGGPDENVISS